MPPISSPAAPKPDSALEYNAAMAAEAVPEPGLPTPDLSRIAAITPHRNYITGALLLVMVLASMEATVTSTAMPTIIGDLHGLEHYSWVASIYLLASTITMPLYGRLADVLGRKRILNVAIILFTFGSVCAAFSRSMPELILFRSIQGLGAGGIMPVVLTILGDIYTVQERARIQGVFSAVWGTASLAGPQLGAWIVNTTKYRDALPASWAFFKPMLGWPMIFWVNLPFGFLGLFVLALYYRDHERHHKTNLDLPGLLTLAMGTTALLAGVSLLSGTVPIWLPMSLIGVAVIVLGVFYGIERSAANPIISPALMLRRDIGPSIIATGCLGCGVFALDTYVPLYVQGARGGSANEAALCVTPVMLAWAVSSFFAAPLVVKWGFRKTAITGAVFVVAGFIGLLAAAALHAPLWLLTGLLFFTGCGFGPSSMAYLLGAQDAVAYNQRGSVTSLVAFARTIGGALGVGAMGALFNAATSRELSSIPNFHAAELLDPRKLAEIPRSILIPAQSTIATGLLWVFASMLLLAAAQFFVSTYIANKKPQPRPAGQAVPSAGH